MCLQRRGLDASSRFLIFLCVALLLCVCQRICRFSVVSCVLPALCWPPVGHCSLRRLSRSAPTAPAQPRCAAVWLARRCSDPTDSCDLSGVIDGLLLARLLHAALDRSLTHNARIGPRSSKLSSSVLATRAAITLSSRARRHHSEQHLCEEWKQQRQHRADSLKFVRSLHRSHLCDHDESSRRCASSRWPSQPSSKHASQSRWNLRSDCSQNHRAATGYEPRCLSSHRCRTVWTVHAVAHATRITGARTHILA